MQKVYQEQESIIAQLGTEVNSKVVNECRYATATVNEVLRYRPVVLGVIREARGEGDDTL